MSWKQRANALLRRRVGYELKRVAPTGAPSPPKRRRRVRTSSGDRLVSAPAFVLSSLRSGSTLLRVLLDSHSQIHSPHEFHLRHIDVSFTSKWADRAMQARGLDATALEYLLWDRILHRELSRSGKEQIVVKTPNDVFNVDRILECWPDARLVFLLRHPAAIARSRASLRPSVDEEKNSKRIQRYCEALEQARRDHPGHTVRYEELTSDPATVTRGLCEFLGVPWEADMLEYGRFDHGRFGAGLGDWKKKIKSGKIQPAAPLPAPEETPPRLRAVAAAWGYLPEDGEDAAAPAGAGQGVTDAPLGSSSP